MKAKVATITPQKAKILLKNNTINRRHENHHVTFLAKQIENGQWKLNGQSIVVSKNGQLVDGQHRLMAIVKANQSIKTVFCEDAENDCISSIDTGKARSVADVFSINNVKSATQISSLTNHIFRWFVNRCEHAGGLPGHIRPSHSKLYSIYCSDKKGIEQANAKSRTKALSFMNRGECALAIYLLSDLYGAHYVDEFIYYISDGGDYPKSPTHYLPLFIQKRKHSDVKRKKAEDLFCFIYCFEKWMKKEPVSKIKPSQILDNTKYYYDLLEIKSKVKSKCK